MRSFVAIIFLLSSFLVPVLGARAAFAQDTDEICEGVELTGGSCDPDLCEDDPDDPACSQSDVGGLIETGVNIFSAIVGVAAVIMIIFGGSRYVTAGGDSGKISSAQTTIIYAIVGLVVVAMAQIIVRFVLSEVG